jgi:hypothetical protein
VALTTTHVRAGAARCRNRGLARLGGVSQPVPRHRYAGRPIADHRADRRERLQAAELELFGTGGMR